MSFFNDELNVLFLVSAIVAAMFCAKPAMSAEPVSCSSSASHYIECAVAQ